MYVKADRVKIGDRIMLRPPALLGPLRELAGYRVGRISQSGDNLNFELDGSGGGIALLTDSLVEMAPTFAEIMEAAQQECSAHTVTAHSTIEWLTLMQSEMESARLAWLNDHDLAVVGHVLAMVSLGVSCLRQHGLAGPQPEADTWLGTTVTSYGIPHHGVIVVEDVRVYNTPLDRPERQIVGHLSYKAAVRVYESSVIKDRRWYRIGPNQWVRDVCVRVEDWEAKDGR